MSATPSRLSAKDLQRIAANAGDRGVDPRTVLRYVLGHGVIDANRQMIEAALVKLGFGEHVRRIDGVAAPLDSTPSTITANGSAAALKRVWPPGAEWDKP